MPKGAPMRWLRDRASWLLACLALVCLLVGGLLYLSDALVPARYAWSVGALTVLAVLLVDMARALLAGRIGVDAIAALAIVLRFCSAKTLRRPSWP